MKPDAHFEDFARDCIQLAREQKSVHLRSRLLVLASEWMHAAVHHHGARYASEKDDAPQAVRSWSRADLADLQYYLDHGSSLSETASMLCREEVDVREKAGELGLLEQSGLPSKPTALVQAAA